MTLEINTAYGWYGIGLVLFVGLALLILRPYWAFLFALFVCTAGSINTGLTRTEDLGAYFNLADACMIIMIMAALLEKKRALLIPAPTVVLLAVLTMGFCNSVMQLGLTYGVLRSLRWCLTLPLLIFLTANLVQDERKVRSLLLTLILAAIVAEAQHLYLVLGVKSIMAEDTHVARTMQFIRSGSDLWLLAGFYIVRGLIPHPWVQTAIGGLFLAGFFTLQTRSLALGLMGAWVIYFLWFLKGPHAYRLQRFKGMLPIFVIGLIILIVMGMSAVVTGFGDRFVSTIEKSSDTESRKNAFKVEINDWLNGNPIIGRGLNYYDSRKLGDRLISTSGIAYGHLGYITYLSQLGLIGFLAYGIWLPIVIVTRARRLLQQSDAPPEVVHLAVLTGSTFIYYPLVFLFSSSLLSIIYVPGILVGGVWGITSLKSADRRVTALETPNVDNEMPKSIIAEPFQHSDRSQPLL